MENTPLAKISTKIVKISNVKEDIFKIAGIKSKSIHRMRNPVYLDILLVSIILGNSLNNLTIHKVVAIFLLSISS
ncbi:MAG: hypothetical protein AN490_02805 [Anabaena sp. AL09]|nr:MAG: hypothetical protein AN482_19520 [Anabaena sp. LE011-02]OBQ13528.1 MAG: hypothetical protein AN490_02805 [Anabaena sp. AL09]OBQ39885.1 MAG: hypothetical protein AN485_05395 [Anabaena sp. MDT14b]